MFVITGPTASGKTGKAVALAKAIAGEIISADSRQLYRGMDLGTGKDLDEYVDVPYHMIDICEAGYKYNLFEFLRDYQVCYNDITGRGKPVILCGGTGMYVESVVKGIALPPVPENKELREELSTKSLDELTVILKRHKTLRNNSDIDTCKRAIRAIGIDIDRDTRRRRITERLKARLEAGMVDEVRRLIDSGIAPDDLIYYGLEYKYITLHVIGKLTYDEMFSQLETAIHQFAKRQMTWFRGMERRGTHIHWLPYDMPNDDFVQAVLQLSL